MKLIINPESTGDKDFIHRADALGLDWRQMAVNVLQTCIERTQRGIAEYDKRVRSALILLGDMERQRKIDEKGPGYWHPSSTEPDE
jgi:hypothetical protein